METTTTDHGVPGPPVSSGTPPPGAGDHGAADAASASALNSAAVSGLSDGQLQDRLTAGFAARRHIDADLARLAGEIQSRSLPSAGVDGLARRNGCTDAASMVAHLGLISRAEAGRLCRVGVATAPRRSLLGELLPAAFPVLAAAFHAGLLPVDSAQHIITQLTQATPRADHAQLGAAERELVDFAVHGTADDVRVLAARWRDALDVDGVEPREQALIAARTLKRVLLPDGMKRYTLDLDPLSASYLDTAIDAEVTAALRTVRFTDRAHHVSAQLHELPDARTVGQMAADAVIDLARHGLSCRDSTPALAAVTVVVRMTEHALRTGTGAAGIDGGTEPISAGTARRLAAEGDIVPMVLGGASEVLDLGRSRRLFSKAQRIAMAERDGGCAFGNCHRPPSHTEAHHIRWWVRDRGSTDLGQGVLLCTAHHHLVHRHGWDIRTDRGEIWFIPPPTIDPTRTPRRGGRHPTPQLE